MKSAAPTISVPAEPAGSKGRIYLIDAMSFIFRAYHAMARQRPMSTKTGIPTSATFVFVNMLRKLRADFSPEYLAAVFDVSAPTFRDQQATEIISLRSGREGSNSPSFTYAVGLGSVLGEGPHDWRSRD